MFNDVFGSFSWFLNYLAPGACIDRARKVYLEKSFNLYLSRFEYDGIPDTLWEMLMNKPLWENMIFFRGTVAWFEDPVKGLMCLPVSGGWELNALGKPTKWYVHGLAGNYSRDLTEKNSVLMFNDACTTIPYQHIDYELDFILDLEKVGRQNTNAQFQPFIFYADESSRKSADIKKSLISQFKDFVYLRRRPGKKHEFDVPEKDFEVLNTDVEFKFKEYFDMLKERENNILTYLGFKNINIEKRERLLTGEISANDMAIQANYTNSLNARQDAFDDVNKMFGTNIKVKPSELFTLKGAITSDYQLAGGNVRNNDAAPNVRTENPIQGSN